MAATRTMARAAEQEHAFRPVRLRITDVEVHERRRARGRRHLGRLRLLALPLER